jgi:hypothetical protein
LWGDFFKHFSKETKQNRIFSFFSDKKRLGGEKNRNAHKRLCATKKACFLTRLHFSLDFSRFCDILLNGVVLTD